MLTILLALLQAAPTDRPLEEAIARFAAGDEKRREEISKAREGAILPLRKARDRAPQRVDALLYDIKKASAGFETKALVNVLETKRSLDLGEAEFYRAHEELATSLPLVFDPALYRTHYSRKVKISMNDRPHREILESLCRQVELDWGFFYGVVLIGAPERLWPAGPPPSVTPLGPDETQRALKWMDELNDEHIERREEALSALRKLGGRAIPLLEKNARCPDAEKAGRIRDLIAQLRTPPSAGTFHVPAAERQKLAGADDLLLRRLHEERVSFKVADITLAGGLVLLLKPREINPRSARAAQLSRFTLELQNQSLWVALCMVSHSLGFDFLIVDREIVVDTREEIERRLATGR